MFTPTRPPRRLATNSVGQWRLLRSKLNDLLTRLVIAALGVGGIIVAEASRGGARPMEKASAIVGAVFITLVIVVLARYHLRVRRLYANPGPIETAVDTSSDVGSDGANHTGEPNP